MPNLVPEYLFIPSPFQVVRLTWCFALIYKIRGRGAKKHEFNEIGAKRYLFGIFFLQLHRIHARQNE
jgi:hypothetical protein